MYSPLEETMLGLVTIGQSPRDDLMPYLSSFLPDELTIRQVGALDGLTREQISRLAPDASDHVLHTRLRDGSAVTVGRERITPLVQACIDQLENEGANVILLLCTAEFSALQSGVLLVEPDRLLASLVRGLRPHRIGVFLPLASQAVAAAAKWMAVAAEQVYAAASPCEEPDAIVQAARELQGASVDLIVMDCMSYTEAHKRLVTQTTGKPVILAISLVAWLLGELICSASSRSLFPAQRVDLPKLE